MYIESEQGKDCILLVKHTLRHILFPFSHKLIPTLLLLLLILLVASHGTNTA